MAEPVISVETLERYLKKEREKPLYIMREKIENAVKEFLQTLPDDSGIKQIKVSLEVVE